MLRMKKVAVLGSGVMGASIAGHLANVGIKTYLLDIVPSQLSDKEEKLGLSLEDKAVRNRFAQTGKDRLTKEKPSPLYTKEVLDFIQVGNLEDDFKVLSEVDWVIEVVVENLKIKQDLFAKMEGVWKPGTIVSSNTSGISVHEMVEGRSEEFKKHVLGTHFFNPPRYMKLLEIIPTKYTDLSLVQEMKAFAESVLGKGVVIAKDTPNFIANRIGTYGLQITLQAMEQMGLDADVVDAITGRAMGRPKSATFRTLDLVGLDTFVHVANNVHATATDAVDKDAFTVSDTLVKMVENKWLGSKTGQGFYKKVGKEILVLDTQTFEYKPKNKFKSASLEASKRAKSKEEGLQALVYGKDVASELAWTITKKVLLYSANKLGEIADDIVAIDQAMKWGFNWDLGPFELWDAIGVEKSIAKMKAEGDTIPAWIEEMLGAGHQAFYKQEASTDYQFSIGGKFTEIEEDAKKINLAKLKADGKLIKGNKGASLIDIGDDIAVLEFHSPKQAIGADIINMINHSVKEVAANYKGLVIGNQSQNFCVGANLMLMLMEAQDHNWPELDMMVRQFQKAMGSLRTLDRPVVAAPFGMTLGGGVEVSLPADRIQASSETYMGLVEVGVGLIPGGGGNKEMLLRWTEGVNPGDKVSLQPLVNHVFMTVAQAKVSTSGEEARQYKFVREMDGITANNDFLIHDAKQVALGLYNAGYKAPKERKIPVVGETGYNVLRLGAKDLMWGGYISEHDYRIASKLAYVLAGGLVAEGTLVSEQYLLDLEREAFLSLIGEPKTQQRMQYMLTKGKPLRN
ncbi:3-hydroxyacyl-CoA dehydrogenase [Thermoactinomyces sp. DSM 45891]|uniref:3-hydroxyacyl-CoA dehydrogenase/enoyl-CoA hydratase family protein n=1 Tax=Thermoactinomyces sp. DSM 45891 TaxID=1761907 RepID=UPI00091185F1|nr:3-hydroxyacyl-CoA dehydrogenase/enoyl-CoA hydratase family protein [Thermoactinomyces sp. DSM 45891]SFX19549.1 3-hydroxyacyl-CoA dehydrogenase [Thermoactinomyces sp. DSM 45891]